MFGFVISRNGFLVAGGRAVETSLSFVFRMTFYVHRGKRGQARVYPRRWLFLSSQAKAFTLQGRYGRFVGDSAFHTSLRVAPLLVGEHQKWYHQILQKVQNLMPHDYIPSCTVYNVVQQYVLVDYCCFHLISGASTAGPYIAHRNRKRFLLSRSTLREEFVEKKHQVFDITDRPSDHSSPSEPLFPGGASFLSRGVLESLNHNIGAASACSSVRSVQQCLE